MNIQRARQIADQLLGSKTKLENEALSRIDSDRNGTASRDEIVDALVKDKVTFTGGKLVPAIDIKLTPKEHKDPRPPVSTPDQRGLGGRPWFQGPNLAGGNGKAPAPVGVVPADGTQGAGQRSGTKTGAEIDALKGLGFNDVAAAAKTPEDIALVLDRIITYDDGRAGGKGGGPSGSYSAEELLELGTGVCRDYHALSRALLQEAGYEAKLLGYAASDQPHAVTVYRDPKSGKWGVLEYGKLYPPDQLKADSPEEALMMVRPSALVIREYSDGGPSKRSNSAEKVFYTPTYRVFEDFMSGPGKDQGTGVTVTNKATNFTVASNDRKWQGDLQINHDPSKPHLHGSVMAGAWRSFPDAGLRLGVGGGYVPNNTTHVIGSNEASKHAIGFGFVSAEEYHPNIPLWSDIGGSGLHLSMGSHARATAALAYGEKGYGNVDTDGDGKDDKFLLNLPGNAVDEETSVALTNLKWRPSVKLSREFGQHEAFVAYGVDVDAQLMARHYSSGGRGFPINQYVTGGFIARPTPWLAAQIQGYLPIANVSNDATDRAAGRLEFQTPYVTAGTTQGLSKGRYDLAAGVNVGKANIGAFVAVDEDRRSKETSVTAGAQITVTAF